MLAKTSVWLGIVWIGLWAASSAYADVGIMNNLVYTRTLDMGASVPDIATGGIYADDAEQVIYAAGATDLVTQPSIRRFTYDGTFLGEWNYPSSIEEFGGIAGTLDGQYLLVCGDNHVYKIDKTGAIVADVDLLGLTTIAGAIAVHPATGHIFVSEHKYPSRYYIHEYDADFNYVQNLGTITDNLGLLVAGMDIDPATGNFLLVCYPGTVAEISSDLSQIVSQVNINTIPGAPVGSFTSSLCLASNYQKLLVVHGDLFDDYIVEFAIVPEPTSVSLLLVGLLMMRRRLH